MAITYWQEREWITKLVAYLDKNYSYIPCYALRKKLGLRNSSNPVEKANDTTVAQRQKHNGMSWSKSGSSALSNIRAMYLNGENKYWFTKRQLKQSTICNLMAIASSSMALFIFLAGMFTAILFSKVTALNSDQTALSINLRHLITTVNYQKDMARSYTQDGNSMYLDMYHTKREPEYDINNIKTSMTTLTNEAQGQKQLQAIFQNVEGMKEIEQNIINLVSSGKPAEAREPAFGKDFGMLIDGLNQTVAEFEEGMSSDKKTHCKAFNQVKSRHGQYVRRPPLRRLRCSG